MATLDDFGREILDQTPIALPLNFDRPEPIHLRMRRMIEEYYRSLDPNNYETIEEANDFEIPDDPSSYDTTYTEPDLEPVDMPQNGPESALSDAEIAAARELIMKMRSEAQNAANGPDVSSSGPDAAEPARAG